LGRNADLGRIPQFKTWLVSGSELAKDSGPVQAVVSCKESGWRLV